MGLAKRKASLCVCHLTVFATVVLFNISDSRIYNLILTTGSELEALRLALLRRIKPSVNPEPR